MKKKVYQLEIFSVDKDLKETIIARLDLYGKEFSKYGNQELEQAMADSISRFWHKAKKNNA